MKTRKVDTSAGISAARQWITLRVGHKEKQHVEGQAAIAGLSISEYMRRRVFGGRPVVAQVDESMVRELRRVGGLLKHHFKTLREAGADSALLHLTESALLLIIRTIENITTAHHIAQSRRRIGDK